MQLLRRFTESPPSNQYRNNYLTQPIRQNQTDSAGNPCGWRILGGGESTQKVGLQVNRESMWILRGIFGVVSSGIFRRFPAEFIGISGGFIWDKTAEDFKGNLWRLSREIRGKFKRYDNISHFSSMFFYYY